MQKTESKNSETMSFCVDIVTEDSFYENLTLGVVKILENSSCVRNVRVERRNGCESGAITNWEQRHCCALPEDIRNFYASIDGFLLQWNLDIAGKHDNYLILHFRFNVSFHNFPLFIPINCTFFPLHPCMSHNIIFYKIFNINIHYYSYYYYIH